MSLFGFEIRASEFVPRFELAAADDFEDRLEAMTSHHVVLDLIPLTVEVPVYYIAEGKFVICHPSNVNSITNMIRMLS